MRQPLGSALVEHFLRPCFHQRQDRSASRNQSRINGGYVAENEHGQERLDRRSAQPFKLVRPVVYTNRRQFFPFLDRLA